MGEKLGWLGEKLAFGCGALFSWIVVVQGALTACRGGGWALFTLVGLGGMGALVLLGVRYLKPARAFSLGLFTLRLAIALGVVFLFGAQPVQDFKTMYDAACQLARGSREYLQTDYFYNWAYQTGFVAYEALVVRLFGEGLLPLQVLNAVWMAGTGCLVYGIARRFLPETGAMAASLLYALYPGPYFLAAVLTNQHIAVFFFYLGFWLLARRGLEPGRLQRLLPAAPGPGAPGHGGDSGPAALLPGAGGLPPAVLEEKPDDVGLPGVPHLGLWPFKRRGPGAGRADPLPVPQRPELL